MSSRCLIVAEVGLNHNGNVLRAHDMIDAIADAGADAAKFQAYKTSDFVTDRSLMYDGMSQVAMFERCELPDEAWPELQAHCNDRNIEFFATPTSEERLDLLVGLGVHRLKNGSDYLTHLPLIRAMARTGLPTILSTGMATEEEIENAVDAFHDAGGGDLTLMHCTSTYPAAAEDVNLRRLRTLANYILPVGFSDHTDGITAAVGAAALGACMIEKHFTLDRNLPGPDHHFSADPVELRDLVTVVTTMEAMLGDPNIGPTVSELQGRRDYRVTEQDGVYLRRGT